MRRTGVTNKPLAIHGGTPVRDTLLPYGHHRIEEQDIEEVVPGAAFQLDHHRTQIDRV